MPTYERQCINDNCQRRFDVYCRISGRNGEFSCSDCNSRSKRVYVTPFSFAPFKGGLWPIGEHGTHISTRTQLKEVCKREGLISHYLEGKPKPKKEVKPTKWSYEDEKKLDEAFEATVGSGKTTSRAKDYINKETRAMPRQEAK